MKFILLIVLISFSPFPYQIPDAVTILDKVDKNMTSVNRVFEATMTVHGRRGTRVMTMKGWAEGDTRSLIEYLSPPREQGTKMLKLEDNLWIYSPSSDRIIQISGHMLRQSVMGSDLSYEDMMEDRKLKEMYNAEVTGEEILNDRNCWILQLDAKVEDVTYQSRKIWVDTERYVPLKEELFAKSGQILKKNSLSDIEQIDGRWFPRTMVFKDMLKDGEGTKFTLDKVEFDTEIDEYLFSKAALKK